MPPCFNVQFSALRPPFWTSSYLPATSTSNPPHRQHNFELPRAFPLLQRPIRHASASFLDFLVPSRYFNVQSAALRPPFWTSSCLPAASTSNPPRFGLLFGLPRTFPLLQRPIRRTASTILDFLVPSRYFNVQSAAPPAQFWTSSCLPATSTSNPPHRQHNFGLPRTFPLLQRPIRRAASTVICEKLRRISSYGASAHTTYQLT